MVEYRQSGLDATYGALANQTRRAMVERLRSGDARVTELAAGFDMSLAAASKHIRVLESARLLHRTIRGRDHYLSLEPRPLADASEWLASYRAFWERRLDDLEARLRGTSR